MLRQYGASYAANNLIACAILGVVVFGGVGLAYNAKDNAVESKLTAKQSQLRCAVIHDRKKEVISLLESAKGKEEIIEMADAVSVKYSDVTYSMLVDGSKESIMFYHSHGTYGYHPVAGMVLQR